MRNLILTALLILGLAGISYSYTAVNTGKITPSYQKAAGGYYSTGGAMGYETTQATVITGLDIVAGTSANTVQLWDVCPMPNCANAGTGVGTVANGTSTVFEAGAAANTSAFFDLSNSPIRTQYGLESSAADAGGGGYIIYTVQYP